MTLTRARQTQVLMLHVVKDSLEMQIVNVKNVEKDVLIAQIPEPATRALVLH